VTISFCLHSVPEVIMKSVKSSRAEQEPGDGNGTGLCMVELH